MNFSLRLPVRNSPKLNPDFITCGVRWKGVTSGGTHLRGIAAGQHIEETSQQWRAVGYSVSNLTGSGIRPQTFRTNSRYHLTNRSVVTVLFHNQKKCFDWLHIDIFVFCIFNCFNYPTSRYVCIILYRTWYDIFM